MPWITQVNGRLRYVIFVISYFRRFLFKLTYYRLLFTWTFRYIKALLVDLNTIVPPHLASLYTCVPILLKLQNLGSEECVHVAGAGFAVATERMVSYDDQNHNSLMTSRLEGGGGGGVTGRSPLLFSSTSPRSNGTPRALFREKLSVLESK